MVELVAPLPEHIAHVAAHMREEDREEVAASAGLDPLTALKVSVEASDLCYAALLDGVPVCVFGVVSQSLLSSTGVPWLLGTPELDYCRIAFARRSRRIVCEWMQRFTLLHNFVDARNRKSIAWLQWIGFTLRLASPYGVAGMPFHYFCKGRN